MRQYGKKPLVSIIPAWRGPGRQVLLPQAIFFEWPQVGVFDRGLRLIAASFGVGGSDAVGGMLFWAFINDHLVLASCFLD
jgi:hypothetical protein